MTHEISKKVRNYIQTTFTNLLVIFFLGGLMSFSLHAGYIEEAKTLTPIKKYLENLDARKNPADAQKLVMFDIDHVIITPKDQCLHPKYRKEADDELIKFIDESSSREDYWAHVLETYPRQIVDPQIISLINSLNDRGVKTIGFTNTPTGAYGHIQLLEDWRIEELKTRGIGFSSSFPDISFDQIKTNLPGKVPLFKGGILFSCLLPKGAVIKPFLESVGGNFTELCSIDDNIRELESEQQVISDELGLKFKGFHYTEVIERPVEELNRKRMEYQIRTLVIEKKWLSDDEADKELKHSIL